MTDLTIASVSTLASIKKNGSAAEKAAVEAEIRRRVRGEPPNRFESIASPLDPSRTRETPAEERVLKSNIHASRASEAAIDLVEIRDRFFAGSRRLRGFRAVRIRDDKMDTQHH